MSRNAVTVYASSRRMMVLLFSALRTWTGVVLALASVACASPRGDPWPPPVGAPAHTIIVSVDTWHSMIAFPWTEGKGLRTETQPSEVPSPTSGFPSQSSAPSPQHSSYEEWGYAEQDWYLEGRMGLGGVFRALFWASPGVVEVGQYERLWSQRTPDPPSEQFTFRLSPQGYQRLRDHLAATIARREPIPTAGSSQFYAARKAYHVFHHCHHYTARALREAGLPVSTFWALTRGMFTAQLRRAERIAAEAAEVFAPDTLQ